MSAGWVASCSKPAARSATGPGHIVLISVDTLRADHLSSFGYPRRTSPAFDAVAEGGVTFDAAFAQRGLTWPSLTSILTGRYPGSHGVRDNPGWLDASIRTLPEMLQAGGYSTAAFLTNMTSAPNRGLDTLEVFPTTTPGLTRERTADTLATRAAMAWLSDRGESKPFFLWLHLLAPHASYEPPPGYDELFTPPGEPAFDGQSETLSAITREQRRLSEAELAPIIGLYDGEVALIDTQVDMVLRKLSELGLSQSTLVVLTSDHGEELYERGFYFFHKCSISDAVLHIPLVLRLPGVLPAGRRVGAVVESIDIAPTILELAGLERPPSLQGRSLLSLIEPNGAEGWKGTAFSELGEKVSSVRTARWRYIANPLGASVQFLEREGEACYPIAREELYDHEIDPGEQTNVAERYPSVTAEMRRRIREWRQATELARSSKSEIDAETLEQLRALGYLK